MAALLFLASLVLTGADERHLNRETLSTAESRNLDRANIINFQVAWINEAFSATSRTIEAKRIRNGKR